MLVKLDEPMSRHTTMGVGGAAAVFAIPVDVDEAISAIRAFRRLGQPVFILGNGSNLIVADAGYDGVVLSFEKLNAVHMEGHSLICDAGVMLCHAANVACDASLSGLEFAHGIPGTVGGACAMNAGAYDGCMADVLESVDAVTPIGDVQTIPAAELGMGYRSSRIIDDGLVVLRVRMSLSPDDPDAIRARMEDYGRRRRSSQPAGVRSAGSTFKRPGDDFAGRLIEQAGLKGYAIGDACVSKKHAGFVVNKGKATASNVHDVIRHVTGEVFRQFGVRLEPEVRFLP